MSYFINPVEQDQCVFLSHEGETPPTELSAARREANSLLSDRHWHRIVVDVTQSRSAHKPPRLIDFARTLSSDGMHRARVALVVRPEQIPSARLVEKVARHGSVFLTYFLDPEKAMAWVKQTAFRRQTIGRNGKEEV